MELEQAWIREHREVGRGCFRLVVAAPAIAGRAGPGQFVHVRVGEGFQPLLRRPLSVARRDRAAGTLTLLYRVVGEGTALLAGRRPGETLDLLGPLGRGFTLVPDRDPLLVAGGIGVAPLLFLAEEARLAGRQVRVLAGAATAAELVGEEDLAAIGVPWEVSTDDGSRGHCGPVTDLLPALAGKAVYACGPPAMLRQVRELAGGIPGQVSLEAAMACGVGACRGCACRVRGDRYRMVCADGPVFDLDEVVLDG